MKRSSSLFLKVVILLIAVVALAGLIWEPQTEGRNVNADQFSIYFRDPFLAYMYAASIPFFMALYQAFKLLGHIERNQVFSPISVKAVRNIKYCAITFSGLIGLGILFVRLFAKGDDAAGFTALCIFAIFASIVIATAAAVFQKLLQNALDIKSENDLTV